MVGSVEGNITPGVFPEGRLDGELCPSALPVEETCSSVQTDMVEKCGEPEGPERPTVASSPAGWMLVESPPQRQPRVLRLGCPGRKGKTVNLQE